MARILLGVLTLLTGWVANVHGLIGGRAILTAFAGFPTWTGTVPDFDQSKPRDTQAYHESPVSPSWTGTTIPLTEASPPHSCALPTTILPETKSQLDRHRTYL